MLDQKYRVFQMLDSTKLVLIHGLTRQEALDYVIKMDHEQTQRIAYHLWQMDCSDGYEPKSPEHYWFLAEHREDLRHYRYGIEPETAISAAQFKWAAKGSG